MMDLIKGYLSATIHFILKIRIKIFRTIFVILSFSSSIIFTSSCSWILDTNQDIIDRLFDSFILLLNNKDKNEIKKQFTKEKIQEIEIFDNDVDQLFDYYEGKSTKTLLDSLETTNEHKDNLISKRFFLQFHKSYEIIN